MINYGPDLGKLCVILDVLDENKVLVDGPVGVTGVKRHVITIRRLSLTDFTVSIARNARAKTLSKAIVQADLIAQWNATPWAKKLLAKKRRTELTDFDRFKVMMARKQRGRLIRAKMMELTN